MSTSIPIDYAAETVLEYRLPASKKELKGRYPKHTCPYDPWNAIPTRKTKGRS